MTKRVQRYGLTSAAMSVLAGLDREIIINTTDRSLHVHDGVTAGGKKISTDTINATLYQPLNANLTAVAGLATTGIVARTAANTFVPRTLTGTAAEITVSNGDGVAGNPTFSLPTALTFTGKTVTGGTFASPTMSGTLTASGTVTLSGTFSGGTLSAPAISAPTVTGAATYAGGTATSMIQVTPILSGFTFQPSGTLTLVTATPIMGTDQVAKSTVFHTPYKGNMALYFDSANFQIKPFVETSLALNAADNLSTNIYDIFGFNNAGTWTLGTGPTWTAGAGAGSITAGSSARGTGAGSTELELFNGLYVNKNAITLRAGGASLGSIGVRQATYLGTIYCTANGQTGMAYRPAAASGGTANILGLWNLYNRSKVVALNRDSAATYAYAVAAWRQKNNNANNRITWIDGLGHSNVYAENTVNVQTDTGVTNSSGSIGLNFNATTGAPTGLVGSAFEQATTAALSVTVSGRDRLCNIGLNFAQGMEIANAGTINFGGTTASAMILDTEM